MEACSSVEEAAAQAIERIRTAILLVYSRVAHLLVADPLIADPLVAHLLVAQMARPPEVDQLVADQVVADQVVADKVAAVQVAVELEATSAPSADWLTAIVASRPAKSVVCDTN